MKRVFVLIGLVVTILVIVGNGFAQDKTSKASIPNPPLGPEWELVGRGSHGTKYYISTREITYLPKGIVKLWALVVPMGELRREVVNALKHVLLLEGKDPNNAERVWYYIEFDKLNCKTHQYAMLEDIYYSFGREVLDDKSYQHEEWDNIPPGSIGEGVERYVCNKTPSLIPDPSLSSEWKPSGIGYNNLSTYYFNTRKIAYLPKGIVKVLTLSVPRGETRKETINALKHVLLLEGKDPNNAERVWYYISLDKFNCKTHQMAPLEVTAYSFGQAVLAHRSAQHEKWYRILPGSVQERIERYVCKKYRR